MPHQSRRVDDRLAEAVAGVARHELVALVEHEDLARAAQRRNRAVLLDQHLCVSTNRVHAFHTDANGIKSVRNIRSG